MKKNFKPINLNETIKINFFCCCYNKYRSIEIYTSSIIDQNPINPNEIIGY